MKKWVVVSLHVTCWTLILLNNILVHSSEATDYLKASIASSGLPAGWFYFIHGFCYLLVSLTAFYGFYFFVGPYLFVRKKYVLCIAIAAAVLTIMVFVRYLVEFQILVPFLKFHNYFWRPVEPWGYIKNCVGYTFNYCLFGLIAYFLASSTRIAKEKKEMEQEKIQAELSFLRSQVNPHFLFNTINDVYTLTYQKSDEAPVALLKLSEILRYMLEGSNTEKVLLEKEIQYLNNYIELQAIGLKNNLFIDFTETGHVNGQQIAPLLLIPFVENIFKHGVINDADKKAVINIDVEENMFNMVATNSIKKQEKDSTGGIGLKNVKRRLQLLYPGKHQFTISEEGDTFTGLLQIDLS